MYRKGKGEIERKTRRRGGYGFVLCMIVKGKGRRINAGEGNRENAGK